MVGKDRCEIIDENKIKRDRNRNIILGMGIAFVVCFVGFMIFIYPFLLKNIQCGPTRRLSSETVAAPRAGS